MAGSASTASSNQARPTTASAPASRRWLAVPPACRAGPGGDSLVVQRQRQCRVPLGLSVSRPFEHGGNARVTNTGVGQLPGEAHDDLTAMSTSIEQRQPQAPGPFRRRVGENGIADEQVARVIGKQEARRPRLLHEIGDCRGIEVEDGGQERCKDAGVQARPRGHGMQDGTLAFGQRADVLPQLLQTGAGTEVVAQRRANRSPSTWSTTSTSLGWPMVVASKRSTSSRDGGCPSTAAVRRSISAGPSCWRTTSGRDRRSKAVRRVSARGRGQGRKATSTWAPRR